MMEFNCANCKKVIQFNEKEPISLRCHSCGAGEIIFSRKIIRKCVVCNAEEAVEPNTRVSGRHDCWGRGYLWRVKEVKTIENPVDSNTDKQSFMDKIRTIINPQEKSGGLPQDSTLGHTEVLHEAVEFKTKLNKSLEEEKPEEKKPEEEKPEEEKPEEKPKKSATPFRRRGRKTK